ncbi:hypothetical protein DXG01_012344 [Tephrocybe rancida]|nr:hypothetical protein DXG01_012344 [Tephrocybe rancida]
MLSKSLILLALGATSASAVALESRATGGYVQNPSGSASFTFYSGCSSPACGKTASGYTAAINQLAFGSAAGLGAGDACGRCFALTGTADPYSPAYTGPFHSIVVKVTDLWNGVAKPRATQTISMDDHSSEFRTDSKGGGRCQ